MRKIIHLDLDAFFCAVEELRHPELVGKPFAVGGRADQRGVISSCSYAARECGVHSAMPTSRAIRICPGLVLIEGQHHDYSEVSKKVMAILGRYTALIEQVSIDEAFLDVSDLPQSGEQLAQELREVIDRELKLPCSQGVATNKLVAKMATDAGKKRHPKGAPPRSILVIPPGEERSFMASLPVGALWGVGPKTAARLEQMGIHTVGQIAASSEKTMSSLFGRYGKELWLHAQGIDDSPLETEHEVKSISQETTFIRDLRNREELQRTLREQAAQVAYRIRKSGLVASTVRVKVRWSDFSLQTRQFKLPQATELDDVIFSVAVDLLDALWDGERPIRLLGVGVSGLSERVHQLSLLDTADERQRHLVEALDALRARFGENAVQRGDALRPPRPERKKRR